MNLARMVDCLDDSLCDQIINANHDFARSLIISRDGTAVSSIRTNSLCRLKGELANQAHVRINAALLAWSKRIASEYPQEIVNTMYLPGIRPNFDTFREGIAILKYEKGQEYKWHADQGVMKSTDGTSLSLTRCISVVVYLNDDFDGGETEMLGRKYRPRKGRALIFPSNWNYPHRACPVKEGTKYALVTWFHPVDPTASPAA